MEPGETEPEAKLDIRQGGVETKPTELTWTGETATELAGQLDRTATKLKPGQPD